MDLLVFGQRHFNFPVLYVKIDFRDLRIRRVALLLKWLPAVGAARQGKAAQRKAHRQCNQFFHFQFLLYNIVVDSLYSASS